jgi:hypothetical protein
LAFEFLSANPSLCFPGDQIVSCLFFEGMPELPKAEKDIEVLAPLRPNKCDGGHRRARFLGADFLGKTKGQTSIIVTFHEQFRGKPAESLVLIGDLQA